MVPEGARERFRVVLERVPGGATVVELRRPLIGARGGSWLRREVARLRWSEQAKAWSVDWHDGRRWRRYSKLAPTASLERLMNEIGSDSCGLFWPRRSGRSGGEERSTDVALT
jgi:hypothetical protein